VILLLLSVVIRVRSYQIAFAIALLLLLMLLLLSGGEARGLWCDVSGGGGSHGLRGVGETREWLVLYELVELVAVLFNGEAYVVVELRHDVVAFDDLFFRVVEARREKNKFCGLEKIVSWINTLINKLVFYVFLLVQIRSSGNTSQQLRNLNKFKKNRLFSGF
jgi:hypothetical protein